MDHNNVGEPPKIDGHGVSDTRERGEPGSDPAEVARQLIAFTPTLFRAMTAAIRSDDVADPRTMMQIHTLRALDGEPRSFKDLCAHRNVAPPTLSRSIEAMVKRGWVERVPHPDDRRQLVLRLTGGGHRELENAEARTLAQFEFHLSRLTPEERAIVLRSLDILTRALAAERIREGRN